VNRRKRKGLVTREKESRSSPGGWLGKIRNWVRKTGVAAGHVRQRQKGDQRPKENSHPGGGKISKEKKETDPREKDNPTKKSVTALGAK